MDRTQREYLLNKVISGKYYCGVYDKLCVVYPPSSDVKYQADIIYNQTIEACRFENWPSDKDVEHLLVDCNLCPPSVDKELEKIHEHIDKLKLKAYRNSGLPSKLGELKRELKAYKKLHEKMLHARHSLDHLTAKGFAFGRKKKFILYHSAFDLNRQQGF